MNWCLGFLGYNHSSGITGSKGNSILVVWGNSVLFSTVAAPVCIPTNRARGFPFLHTSPALVCCCVYDGHSDQREVVSHCGIILHLPNGSWCWAFFFHVSMGPLHVLLGEVSLRVLCPFSNWIVSVSGVQSWEFSTYFGDQTLVYDVITQYLLIPSFFVWRDWNTGGYFNLVHITKNK